MTIGSPLFVLPSERTARSRAFTLIELMVSMSILAVLLVVLLSMVDASTKLWRHSENQVDSYREARAAINTISADLKSTIISADTNFFTLDRTDKLPSTARPVSEANNIFFLSAQPADAQEQGDNPDKPKNASDVCVVGYFLAFDKIATGSGSKSFNLYRYFLSSDDSFKAIQSEKLLTETLSTSPTASAPAGAEVLARNITSFKVKAFTVDAKGVIQKFTQSDTTPMPDFADIELTALNNEAVKRFTTNSTADWTNTSSATYQQNARTFRTRVHFPAEAVTDATPTPTPTPTPASSS